ncbi:geranylgeranylglyceryl/heptaprenylglyceryl phosphate synthase [Marinilabilia rubra]|uniref:Geranylgeranylglyceryl phosphate synthase n=1 Tax=Marinilabilia rubra TaxID=2162893 RepID=A0A2U2BDY8_9BACT|nr:geranylgeranylglyceryl/heptaprenylglyceryl phosphate synthase [Marinilabilia rubra]PWE01271.1 geranylgeranylglyceryl/heptaprenylglyceryl phosphate synthase [Marinilabilia rubra]
MRVKIQAYIENYRTNKKKMLALLIDPDKCHGKQLDDQAKLINHYKPQLILVGGSLTSYPVDEVVRFLKEKTEIPVVLYPGHPVQISFAADALLFLSMISGRNAELLIGAHVTAAPTIHKSGIETISTGYMLIDGGTPTSVEYISQTQPIPAKKTDIALATALAGQMLGLKMIYMDAGSGADQPVPSQMIEKVKDQLSVPLMIGGGIDTPNKLENAYNSGADIVVVGNALEKSPDLLKTFTEITLHS